MTRTRKETADSSITVRQLLSLSLAPAVRWVRRRMLEARLRSLKGVAEYFEWQEANGRAGLADTHKQIALAQSDLRQLQKR